MFNIGDEVVISPDDVDAIICNIFAHKTRGVIVKNSTSHSFEVYLYRYRKSEIFKAQQLTLCDASDSGKSKLHVSVHFYDDGQGVRLGTLDRAEDGYFMGCLSDGQPFCCPENYIFLESEVPEKLAPEIDAAMIKRALFRSWFQSEPDYHLKLFKEASSQNGVFTMSGGEYLNPLVARKYKTWLRRGY